MNREEQILQSWRLNAQEWINTINQGAIESRRLGTNQAIIDALLRYQSTNILDLGCGEGWLTRALAALGINAFGADAIDTLIEDACRKGPEHFQVLSYEAIMAGAEVIGAPFDGIVINFGLFADDENLVELLNSLHRLLTPGGRLFIQTIHPFSRINQPEGYRSHWVDNSWEGLPGNYTQGHQWYFRTFGHWLRLFSEAGYRLVAADEPLHPQTGKPLSVIFVATSVPA